MTNHLVGKRRVQSFVANTQQYFELEPLACQEKAGSMNSSIERRPFQMPHVVDSERVAGSPPSETQTLMRAGT